MENICVENRQYIIIDSPLYTKFNLSSVSMDEIQIVFSKGSLESYCPHCEKRSLFNINKLSGRDGYSSQVPTEGIFTVVAKCMGNDILKKSNICEYELYSCFKIYFTDIPYQEIIKIGQHPSLADNEFGKLDDFYKELDEKQRKEFGRAIGLYAHGISIGSYVYLRRIFENLVEEAHMIAKDNTEWNEDKYNKCKMDKKIILLKEYLPKKLFENSKLYSILSKGIHALTEEECIKYFPLLRQSISYILSERYENKQYEKVKKDINSIT